MKLLFDENLAPVLAERLADIFPGSRHVFHLLDKGADDAAIWKFAVANEFTIVSKDSDFAERGLLSGGLPKVIWLRTGNCLTSDVEKLIRANYAAMQDLPATTIAA